MAPAPTVFVHVGVPKSGTTFLQGVLDQYRKQLLRVGLLYPPGPGPRHFLAALDARGNDWFGGTERDAEGAWKALVERCLNHQGTSVISHEVLATASQGHAQRALALLAGAEVHVILTARDPARQMLGQWQELIKHGRTLEFTDYSSRVLRRTPDDGAEPELALWRSQDLPEVLAHWGQGLDPRRVHVVTVPPPSADPVLLWQRFGTLLGIDPAAFDVSSIARRNPSLGVAQTEALRRVNVALDGALTGSDYGRVVKSLFAQQILGSQQSSRRPRLPKELLAACGELAASWVQTIESRQYDVVGSLADLHPDQDPTDHYDEPTTASHQEVAEVTTSATAELLVTIADLRRQRRKGGQDGGRRRG
jgi:hypothetical protein